MYFFLLIFFVTGCQAAPTDEINLAVDHSKSLICYQCKSTRQDKSPLCDFAYFKLTTAKEKSDMMFQCPPFAAGFCFAAVEVVDGVAITTRGCHPRLDANNDSIKTGCLVSSKGYEKLLCFCDTNLCNGAVFGAASCSLLALIVLNCCMFLR